jgi:hypothetical protein
LWGGARGRPSKRHHMRQAPRARRARGPEAPGSPALAPCPSPPRQPAGAWAMVLLAPNQAPPTSGSMSMGLSPAAPHSRIQSSRSASRALGRRRGSRVISARTADLAASLTAAHALPLLGARSRVGARQQGKLGGHETQRCVGMQQQRPRAPGAAKPRHLRTPGVPWAAGCGWGRQQQLSPAPRFRMRAAPTCLGRPWCLI